MERCLSLNAGQHLRRPTLPGRQVLGIKSQKAVLLITQPVESQHQPIRRSVTVSASNSSRNSSTTDIEIRLEEPTSHESKTPSQPATSKTPSPPPEQPSQRNRNSATESPDPSTPEPPQKPLFLRLLALFPAPPWLAGFVKALQNGEQQAIRILRLTLITAIFVGVALVRSVVDMKSQVRTREMLYSDFVSLLDKGRVRAARLEAGTGRLYFDVMTLQPAATAVSVAEEGSTAQATAVAAATTAATMTSTQTSTPATTSISTPSPTAPTVSGVEASTPVGQAAAAVSASTSAAAAAVNPNAPRGGKFQKQFVVKLAEKNDYLLSAKILAAGVEYGILKQNFMGVLQNALMTMFAVWVPLLPMFFLIRGILQDRTSTSRKKKTDNKNQPPATTFKDVAGVDSAKEELMETVTVMKSAKSSYTKLNVKIPSGVLLCGPPGTGKTLLAKAVAGEAGVPFFAFSASEFVELYVGRGAARVREVFAEARKSTPCVIFIDELDALGARRGVGYNDERDQTLNQLLTELDGFEGRQGILFLAATNRIEILDPALLRPGRINRKVTVPLPDEPGRFDILQVHLRSTPMVTAEDKLDAAQRLAKVTSGFSGAELANVVTEATLLAARQDQDVVTFRELLEGVRRTKFGVNGATSKGVSGGFQKWLMDIATASVTDKQVKTATAL